MIINMTSNFPEVDGCIELLPYCDTERFDEFWLPDEFLPSEIINKVFNALLLLREAYWTPNQNAILKNEYGAEIGTRREYLEKQEETAKTTIDKYKKSFAVGSLVNGEIRSENGRILGQNLGIEARAVKYQRHLLLEAIWPNDSNVSGIYSVWVSQNKDFCFLYGTEKIAVSVLTKKPVQSIGEIRDDWVYLKGYKMQGAASALQRKEPDHFGAGFLVNRRSVDRIYSASNR